MASSLVRRHNETVLRDLEEGDMIEFPRGPYSHWGVYVGDGQVVHLAGEENDGLNVNSGSVFTICGRHFNKAFVRSDEFHRVCDQSMARKNNSKDRKLGPRSRKEIVDQAFSMIGEIGYNVLWKNCEHFASFCRYGVEKSEQADKFLTWATIGGLALGVLGVMWGTSGSKKKEEDKVVYM